MTRRSSRRFFRCVSDRILITSIIYLLWFSCLLIITVVILQNELYNNSNNIESQSVLLNLKTLFNYQNYTGLKVEAEQHVLAEPKIFNRPGEMGKPFVQKNLSPEQREIVADGKKTYGYNVIASDRIGVRRTIPDGRDDWCKEPGRYKPKLKASVIFCVYNEQWTVLLRSIHSILERTPSHLLEEIVIIDDFSEMEHLKGKLRDYMKQYPKVKLVRTKKREGLIRARLIGEKAAKGPVLVFFDSHIEVNVGWIEPLLSRLEEKPKIIVCPVIDLIDSDTFEYKVVSTNVFEVGGFLWDMMFKWVMLNEQEKINLPAKPVKTPTMLGGLYAIRKDYFNYLGGYDPEYNVWGAENLELSFKSWTCGDGIEFLSCSHVGHIFRGTAPYRLELKDKYLNRNLLRLAHTWLDEYSIYVLRRLKNPNEDFGDISRNLALRKRLKCHSFDWYMHNVVPNEFNPKENAIAEGEIRNMDFDEMMCLDANEPTKVNDPIGVFVCHGSGGNQHWWYTKLGEIKIKDVCVDYNGERLMFYACHEAQGNQYWLYNTKTKLFRHPSSGLCLELVNRSKLEMKRCNSSFKSQQFKIQYYDHSKKLVS